MKKLSQQIGVAAIAFVGSTFLSCEKVKQNALVSIETNAPVNGVSKGNDQPSDLRQVDEGLTDGKLALDGVAKPNYEKMFATLTEINFMLGEIKCMVRHRARQTGVELDYIDSNKPN